MWGNFTPEERDDIESVCEEVGEYNSDDENKTHRGGQWWKSGKTKKVGGGLLAGSLVAAVGYGAYRYYNQSQETDTSDDSGQASSSEATGNLGAE